MRRCNRLLAALALLAAAQAPVHAQEAERERIALMGTIPIYWGESEDFGDLINGTAQTHWARAVIERRAEPVPLDYLSVEALAPFDMLLLAQPRGLTGEENVALDAWVRGGGRLLLFADPWMTGESRFGIGDRRRPQDVALLSPILTHWGVQLLIDAAQYEGIAYVDHLGTRLPVNMRGVWDKTGDDAGCLITADALLAECTLGEGEVLLVADAAMLDLTEAHATAAGALEHLLQQIFGDSGDQAGNRREIVGSVAESQENTDDGQ